jgi:hypothetical protein
VTVWAFAFLVALAVCGLATGAALLAAPRLMPIPRSARFFCGLSLGPYAAGLVVLLLLATFPGLPWAAIQATLAALALTALWRTRALLRKAISGNWRAVRREWRAPQFAAAAAMSALIGFVGLLLAINAGAPLIAFDALQYSREAALLGAATDLAGWVGHTGTADGTFRGDIHHPIYVGYLAWAQHFAPAGVVTEDLALRLAFQATFLCMLAALTVVGLALRWRWWSLAPIPLLLLVPQFDYVSASASRDAFRMVPIAIVSALLLRLGLYRWRPRQALDLVAPISAASALALMGHTLNGFVMLALLGGWSLWALCARRPFLVPLAAVAVGTGLGLGAWTYADAWLSSGHIQGSGVLMYSALEGTPMLDRIRVLEQASTKGVTLPLARLQEALLRDGRGLAVAGCVASLAAIIWAVMGGRRRWATAACATAVTALVIALPVLGVFDVAGFEVSQWFVTNQRYALHWYIFLAAALAAPFAVPRGAIHRAQPWALVLLCLATAFFTLKNWYRNSWDMTFVDERLRAAKASEQVLGSQRLLLEDARWNYYLGNRHLVMYSRATAPTFRAQPGEAMETALNAMGAGGALLTTSSLDSWWSLSTLMTHFEASGACRIDLRESGQTLYLRASVAPPELCNHLRRKLVSPQAAKAAS